MGSLEERVIFTKDQPQITTDGSVVRLELPEIFWASQYGYDRFKVLDTWVNHVSHSRGLRSSFSQVAKCN